MPPRPISRTIRYSPSCRGLDVEPAPGSAAEPGPPFWQAASRLNPFFYAIDGFRYGFFGQSDVPPWESFAFATLAFAVLSWLTLAMLSRGYKLRH